ncbi:MAG TPA: PfkB family carbohydrate kinase [Verrucomicrobiales bacterium]|nr:PfkB family carbohydrate kinase [Verrucomicrobiales bacterium]
MSILISGTVALDSIHTPTEIHNELLGGSASYAALAAALHAPVHLCSIVGRDFPAEHSALLKGNGIDIANIEFAEGRTFRWTGRYHENMNHRETLDVSIDVLEKFAPQLTPEAAAAKVVLLANMSPDNQLAVLNQVTGTPFVIADSMDLWINIARERLLELMKRVDLFVINEDEAKMFTEASNLVTAGWRLMEMGPKHVVVKKGEHGALLFGRDKFFATPAYPLTGVADPTGAGDSFAGGLAGSLAVSGKTPGFADLAAGVVRGSVLASFTCEAFGVKRLASVTKDDAAARMAEFRAYTLW